MRKVVRESMGGRGKRRAGAGSVRRHGFTLIELLVVISIIAVLVSLITPAVQAAREAARKLQCLNNVKNLAQAMANFHTAQNRYPDLMERLAGTVDVTDSNLPIMANWAVHMFPYADNGSAIEYIRRQSAATQRAAFDTVIGTQAYNVFTCPDDQLHFRQGGGLSYVVNIGYGEFVVNTSGAIVMGPDSARPDFLHTPSNYAGWDGDTSTVSALDQTVARASGVFWFRDDARSMTSDQINNGDGQSQTLLITENLNAANLLSVSPLGIGFGLGRPLPADGGILGMPVVTSPSSTLALPPAGYANLGAFQINSNLGSQPGSFPVPSSNHPGAVNVAFADGRCQSVSDKVDANVWVQLHTWAGVRWGQAPVADGSY